MATKLAFHRFDAGPMLTIIVLCILVSVASALNRDNSTMFASDDNSTMFASDTGRIVGGNQASVGEYPYFVSTRGGGCGGVLVASEWVLTAVHCGNMVGDEVIVGPYERWTTAFGGKKRQCISWIRDPGFEYSSGNINSPNAPYKKDAALCKLNEPVYVDDSKVGFRLNDFASYPPTGTDVVAIGFGTTRSGGPQPKYIQEVTVKVNSNSYCSSAPSSIYSSQSISAGILCASVPGGGKDACQGDSGGPLVRKTSVNGKRVDYHVGITSWGVGCGDARYPGVYSRTAYSYGFIRRTICTAGNTHPFCQSPLSCGSNQEELVVRVVPDMYPSDISWTLTRNGVGIVRSKSQGFFKKRYFTYEESICLNKGSTYTFVMNDSWGDGLTTGENGFYSLTLDGKQIARGTDYQSSSTKVFKTETTPTKAPTPKPTSKPTPKPTPKPSSRIVTKRGPCDDRPGWRFNNIDTATCYAIFEGGITTAEQQDICNTKDTVRDRRVKHFCPSYCRRKCLRDSKTMRGDNNKVTGKMMKGMKGMRNNMNRRRKRRPQSKRQEKSEFVLNI